MDAKTQAMFYATIGAIRSDDGKVSIIECVHKETGETHAVLVVQGPNGGVLPVGRIYDEPAMDLYEYPGEDAPMVCGCRECMEKVIAEFKEMLDAEESDKHPEKPASKIVVIDKTEVPGEFDKGLN